ncbi:hypothetical protein KUTeg_020137 [Tegillarca granosa]|uniref:Uncharacterized protein n=1 Tax=Tegillarca granosa TaxID=220873 RepID=A0ABQ9ECC8_TEGGR|nr:hypothetical protein KUTeg_020137 [Tegillarca granosa]
MKQCHGVQEYLSSRKKHFMYEDLCKIFKFSIRIREKLNVLNKYDNVFYKSEAEMNTPYLQKWRLNYNIFIDCYHGNIMFLYNGLIH